MILVAQVHKTQSQQTPVIVLTLNWIMHHHVEIHVEVIANTKATANILINHPKITKVISIKGRKSNNNSSKKTKTQ